MQKGDIVLYCGRLYVITSINYAKNKCYIMHINRQFDGFNHWYCFTDEELEIDIQRLEPGFIYCNEFGYIKHVEIKE